MSSGTGNLGENTPGAGSNLKPYLKRKKSSLGETKIAVLGADGVGKSALSVRFLTKRFIGEYDQTAENKYKYVAQVDGESVSFEVLDTRSVWIYFILAGNKDNYNISDEFEFRPDPTSDCGVICPRVFEKSIFCVVATLASLFFSGSSSFLQNNDCGAREDILRWADGYILMYSVVCRKSFELLQEVNKTIDEHRRGTSVPVVVIGNKSDLAHMRQVTHDEGKSFADEIGCPFIELSTSEDASDVTEAFYSLCREIMDYKRRTRTFFDRVFGAFGREKAS